MRYIIYLLMFITSGCFASDKAFVLFYKSTCPHCRRFDPILKQYAVAHGIPVLAYTIDGSNLPSFPNSIYPTKAEVEQFFPQQQIEVPALFIMDIKNKRILPVMKGEATYKQLSGRVKQIIDLGN
ncbi:MAG: conjugal transfer protein TraF [Candidatus Thioglobus sp.]